MAQIRSTAKHYYSTEDRLGQGATCTVFKGLSKDGEFHALKIFEPYAVKDISREVAALSQLKHENIIHFIGVEHETTTRQVVVVMEFCEGGSLSSYLQQADNSFGLLDKEFLVLLKDLVSGMQHLRSHGLVHRDIKPGNILRSINKDGSSLFKLSDFGTARPLEDDEYFKSLVGTEEYLHPDLFSAAFMNQGKSLRFPHSVDLWSLGATLYNAATGDVPFCPYRRRQDKDTMYKMISEKPAGVIGARQDQAHGEIQWLYHFPDTCQLSGGLQDLMVAMLASLFERDPTRMWTFDRLFAETQTTLSLEAVTVLALFPYCSPYDSLYLPRFDTVSQLKERLGERWPGTDGRLRCTLYGETNLSDFLRDDDQLFDMPVTDTTTPIIALPSCVSSDLSVALLEPSISKILSEELTFSGTMTHSEVNVGHAMCGTAALIDRKTRALATFQQHLLKLRHRLRYRLGQNLQNVEKRFELLADLFDVISGTADRTGWSAVEQKQFEEVKAKMSSITEQLHAAKSAAKLPFEDNQWCFAGDECVQLTNRAKEEAESWLQQMKEHKKSAHRASYSTPYEDKCVLVCKRKLEEVYKRTVSIWSEKCFQKLALLRTSFLDLYRSFLEADCSVNCCEEDLSEVMNLTLQLFKCCVNRSSTQKVSKSLLTTNHSKVDRSQILDLKNKLQNLATDLEEPEIFGVPPINDRT